MNRPRPTTAIAWLTTLLCGCAAVPSAPVATTEPAANCSALAADRQRTDQALQAAEQQQQQAWKAVVPFAVLARYGQGRAAATQAQRRQDELRGEAAALGCATAP